ncbi:homoserine dehydrogenase [Candidatus Mycalebacterium sp.]
MLNNTEKKVKIGLIGAGTVGCGVYEVVRSSRKIIKRKTGVDLVIKRIADTEPNRKRPIKIPKTLFTEDAYELINDPEIDTIIELIGGTTAARKFALAAIKNGKHLVTANKALLALKGKEIFSAAAKKGVEVGFEASVGGGIPLIQGLREGFCANKIVSIHGIMNGTSNYILHKMSAGGQTFKQALADAQREGYAEADPSFDVNGTDSAHKLLILIALAWGNLFSLKDITVEGIAGIDSADISYAREFGYKIKPLATAKISGGAIEAGVYPALVGNDTQLASVNGAFNAVRVEGDRVGPAMFYGMGAGMMPTASAVVSDVVRIARGGSAYPSESFSQNRKTPRLKPAQSVKSRFYAKFQAKDAPGVLGKISAALGKSGISIQSVIQKPGGSAKKVPVVIMTRRTTGENMRAAVAGIEKRITKTPAVVLRVSDI